jgi:hypothetical protein
LLTGKLKRISNNFDEYLSNQKNKEPRRIGGQGM